MFEDCEECKNTDVYQQFTIPPIKCIIYDRIYNFLDKIYLLYRIKLYIPICNYFYKRRKH